VKEYVLVHARCSEECDLPSPDVLLILKNKPEWQNNRLNLCGGKVEDGESVIECAVRELKEEAGLDPVGIPVICGIISGSKSLVHCVLIDVDRRQELNPRAGETEKVDWFRFGEAWDDERLIPNLRVIVPMMHAAVTGWQLIDQYASSYNIHEVVLQLPLTKPFENE